MIKPRWNRKLFRTFKNNNKSSSRRKDLTWLIAIVEQLVRLKRKSGHVFEMLVRSTQRKATKFWNVGYTAWFLPVAFTPFSTACFSPSSPFWHRMPVFMGCLETLPPPLVAFNATRESFFRGVRVVVVRFSANVFRRKKKTKKKGSLNFLKHIITFL